jgi:hypothetical protein
LANELLGPISIKREAGSVLSALKLPYLGLASDLIALSSTEARLDSELSELTLIPQRLRKLRGS